MDLQCVVCDEPWDSYGVRNGDMKKWEADLFLKGAGCPCCEGDSEPADGPSMEAIRHNVFSVEPEIGEIQLFNALDGNEVPKWERPPDKMLKSCDCCSLELWEDTDDNKPYWRNWGSRYHEAEPSEEFFAEWLTESSVCEDCQIQCKDCGCQLLDDDRDIYDGRVVYHRDDHYRRTPLCLDCCLVREREEAEEALSSLMSEVAEEWLWEKDGEEEDEDSIHDLLLDCYGKGLIKQEDTKEDMVHTLIMMGYAQKEQI